MKGSCLCGEVKYEITKLDSAIEHCSCNTCRKAHAAAFNSAAEVLREDFKWLQGELKLSVFESSKNKLRWFCSKCGSHIISENTDKPYIMLRVATLDDDPKQMPEFQIWKSHEVSWLKYGPDIPAFQEWEPNHGNNA